MEFKDFINPNLVSITTSYRILLNVKCIIWILTTVPRYDIILGVGLGSNYP